MAGKDGFHDVPDIKDRVEPVPSALESEHAQEGESPSLAELPASN